MSWRDKVQNPFIITTGDGVQYSNILWKNDTPKEIDYNITEFDFPNIAGSLIFRGTNKARKFSLHIIFQGDDQIDIAEQFEESANDPRLWTVQHPIYGTLTVQPVSLKFDPSGFNTTVVTGTLLETIVFGGPKITKDPRANILFQKQQMDELTAEAYQVAISQLKPGIKDVNTLTAYNKVIYDIGTKTVKLTEDAGNYFNAFNAANASIQSLASNPLLAMQDFQTVINYPSQFVDSIKNRITTIQTQFGSLSNQVGNILSINDKKNFEATGVTLVSSMAIVSVTSYDSNGNIVTGTVLPDYATKQDVLDVIEDIQIMYNAFLALLDSLQTTNGGLETSYIPDAGSLQALDQIISFTISNLTNIALSSKQERIVLLTEDSNVIIQAHKYYGLLIDDSTIDTVIKNNGISLNEIMQLSKGRELLFYI
jgi:hypothetical protein